MSKPYHLIAVKCQGNESSLAECKHNGWNTGGCPIDHEAGVVCNGKNALISFIPLSPEKDTFIVHRIRIL